MSLINIGSGPNAGDGESLRSAFNKINIALNDDANYNATITTALATKASISGLASGSVPVGGNGVVIPVDSGTGQVTRSLPSHLSDRLISVKDLGLTGTGNERTALQALLTSGRSFYIPAGMVITVGSGVTISVASTRIFGPGSISCSAGTFTAITVAADKCQITDLKVVGSGGGGSGGQGACLRIEGNENRISGCLFENGHGAVYIANGSRNRVIGNYCGAMGITEDTCGDIVMQSTSSGGQIINDNIIQSNMCFGGQGYGVVGQLLDASVTSECQRNIIANNIIGTHKAYGIMLYDQDNDGNSVHLTTGNVISGNTIKDITGETIFSGGSDKRYGAGIYVQSFENTTIIGNTVDGCCLQTDAEQLAPGGIGIANVGKASIIGNTIFNSAFFGIYLNDALLYGDNAGGITVSGNTISGSGKSGIKGTRLQRYSITNNAIGNSGEFGLIIMHSTLDSNYGVVAGNTIRHNTGNNNGMNIQHCNGVSVTGNYISGSTVNGIGVFSSKQVAVVGNVCMEITNTAISVGSSCSEGIVVSSNLIRKSASSTSRGIELLARTKCAGNELFGFTNFANTTSTNNTAWNGTYIPFQPSAPTTGTWIVGDVVDHSAPAPSTTPGWICTTGGTPGTWKAKAPLEA